MGPPPESSSSAVHRREAPAPPLEAGLAAARQQVERAAERARETLYTFGEELAHGLTHGIGAVLAIAGLAGLVAKAAVWGGTREIVVASIFGASLVLMYTASTLFHAIPLPALPNTKRVLRVIDHCLIYVLIAGTYTPFTLLTLHDPPYAPWGWSLFGFVWGLAAVGIAFKIFTTGRFEAISLTIYLLMGWCGLVAVQPLLHALAVPGLWLLLAGGLCYSFGVAFYLWERLRYHHAIWHACVLAGSACHYFAVLLYVLPGPSAR
ncbi:MAG: hemolysin III family protein [Nevskia sp.]|nr:hemolysin III family protein [Nevskia sp.]